MDMKIAVPVDNNGILDSHFGHCAFFLISQVENDKVVASVKVQPPPHEPGLLPRWLAEQGVTHIIAGGMGQRAVDLFKQNGVVTFVGAPKISADILVQKHLSSDLELASNHCDH
jgi:predicted Fe-Mo cluster-binding NifX family protein